MTLGAGQALNKTCSIISSVSRGRATDAETLFRLRGPGARCDPLDPWSLQQVKEWSVDQFEFKFGCGLLWSRVRHPVKGAAFKCHFSLSLNPWQKGDVKRTEMWWRGSARAEIPEAQRAKEWNKHIQFNFTESKWETVPGTLVFMEFSLGYSFIPHVQPSPSPPLGSGVSLKYTRCDRPDIWSKNWGILSSLSPEEMILFCCSSQKRKMTRPVWWRCSPCWLLFRIKLPGEMFLQAQKGWLDFNLFSHRASRGTSERNNTNSKPQNFKIKSLLLLFTAALWNLCSLLGEKLSSHPSPLVPHWWMCTRCNCEMC